MFVCLVLTLQAEDLDGESEVSDFTPILATIDRDKRFFSSLW